MHRFLFAAVAMAALAQPAAAQNLRVAMSAEPSSADPHHYALTPNTTYRQHVFENLVRLDAQLKVQPALATAWERRDDRTWVFTLREGVRFHDGRAFTSQDVLFSYCRTLNNEAELVSSFSGDVRRIETISVEGPHRLLIRTREPDPLFLSDLAAIAIIPHDPARAAPLEFSLPNCGGAGPWPQMAQFNEGAAIGTGPFKLRSFTRGGAIEFTRNEDYWGEKPHWREVRLLPVTQNGPRMAGLLAGDFDLIESPATADLPRLRENQSFRLATAPTTRLIFLQLDFREPAPFVNAGTAPNPLRDPRVRQALSLAIDRNALRERIMDGLATPAAQFLPEGMNGTIPGLPVLPFDPARARALLTEAGYPNGFSLTYHATNNRYINDSRIAQAIAQFWQRIGVRAEVDAMPSAVFFTRRGRRELSVAMGGWGAAAEDTLLFFRTWLVTTDREKGLGTSNYGGWTDAAFDRATLAANVTMDAAARAALLQEAGRRALAEMPVIPVHFESAVWAFRRGLTYAGRMDQSTDAAAVRPE